MITVRIDSAQAFTLVVTDNNGKEHSSHVESGGITMGIDRERTFRVVPESAPGGSPAEGE